MSLIRILIGKRIIKKWVPAYAGIALAFFLSACGFQLRGTTPMPEVMQRIAIEPNDPYLPFQQEVRELLTYNGVAIVSISQKPNAILHILKDNFSVKDTSIGADGRIREQSYTYVVVFSVTSPEGEVLIPNQTVSSMRLIEFNPDLALAQSMQEQIILEENRNEVAGQLVRRLAFPHVSSIPSEE